MSNDRFGSAHEMVREYAELEAQMADPSIHNDQAMRANLGADMPNLVQLLPDLKPGNQLKMIC